MSQVADDRCHALIRRRRRRPCVPINDHVELISRLRARVSSPVGGKKKAGSIRDRTGDLLCVRQKS